MCSATQCGLRVWRLKEERWDGVVERSEMGPGKPYWRTPEGKTGEIVAGVGGLLRTGESGEVLIEAVVVGLGVVVEDLGCCFGLEEEEKMAAVTAEPANAEAAAMRARVVLDMVGGTGRRYMAGNVAGNGGWELRRLYFTGCDMVRRNCCGKKRVSWITIRRISQHGNDSQAIKETTPGSKRRERITRRYALVMKFPRQSVCANRDPEKVIWAATRIAWHHSS
jgi:hypothetical protein